MHLHIEQIFVSVSLWYVLIKAGIERGLGAIVFRQSKDVGGVEKEAFKRNCNPMET